MMFSGLMTDKRPRLL